ncbi:MAG: hypothetical protein MJ222_03215 [Bacilli bacterium]|nr:hypothetical protein [Bacilli bacterium]
MILKKFNEFSKIVRIVLLAIPFCNWVVELILRWSLFIEKKDAGSLIVALVATFGFGVVLGWIDAIFTAMEDKIVLTDLKLN